VSDLITSDHPLNAAEQSLLGALLDTLVPASDDGEMPSAADLGFAHYLLTQAQDFTPALQIILARFDNAFCGLPMARRVELVQSFSIEDPQSFAALLTHVYDCYYQDDRVRQAIGMVQGPVFPQGNDVMAGDLSLLDPVIANSEQHQYRKI
jgi:hypothetical protein